MSMTLICPSILTIIKFDYVSVLSYSHIQPNLLSFRTIFTSINSIVWIWVHSIIINNNAYEHISTKIKKCIRTMLEIKATDHILIIIVAYWKKKRLVT